VTFGATQHLRSLVVEGNVTLAPGGGRAISTGALLIAGGTLDLGDNDLVLDYTGASEAAAVGGYIAAGHSAGEWNGQGIVTSMPAAADGLTSLGVREAADVLALAPGETAAWNGVTVDATSVLVKYTYCGDANLDGFISGDDYSAIDFAVGVGGSSGWWNGDFNHDGFVSGDDYARIDFNLVAQTGML
jgi:hypothetical protein